MTEPSFFNPPEIAPPGSYSHVAIIPAGRQLHLSGQVALDGAGTLVGRDDLKAQADQAFRNVEGALAAAGASMAAIAKLTIYVVDLTPERADIVRTARSAHFASGRFPAATMVGVVALVDPELLVEVEAIAVAA